MCVVCTFTVAWVLPGQCGSVGRSLVPKPKGRGFDAQSRHRWETTSHASLSLPLPLKPVRACPRARIKKNGLAPSKGNLAQLEVHRRVYLPLRRPEAAQPCERAFSFGLLCGAGQPFPVASRPRLHNRGRLQVRGKGTRTRPRWWRLPTSHHTSTRWVAPGDRCAQPSWPGWDPVLPPGWGAGDLTGRGLDQTEGLGKAQRGTTPGSLTMVARLRQDMQETGDSRDPGRETRRVEGTLFYAVTLPLSVFTAHKK